MNRSIVIVAAHYYPHIGGVELYTQNLSKQLVKNNFKVTIVTSNLNKMPFKSVTDGITVYRLHVLCIFGSRFPIPYSLFQLWNIFYECFYLQKVICIVQTRLFFTSTIGALLAFFSRSRLIFIEHGSGKIQYKNAIYSYMFHIFEHMNTAFIKLFRPEWFGVSAKSKDWLRHYGIHPDGILANSISLDSTVTDSPLAQQLLTENKKIVLFASRLLVEKGVIELIDGFSQFSNRCQDYVLLILGKGEAEQEVRRKIMNKKSIIYLGELPHEKLLGILKHAHCFVSPSKRTEGLPTVVLESGMFAIPVISTILGGTSEVIQHLKTGYVLRNTSPGAIEEALLYLDQHPTECREMAGRLQSLVKDNYQWNKIVTMFIRDTINHQSRVHV